MISLRKAAHRLKKNPHYVHGAADGLGISLMIGGTCLFMTSHDFEKLKARVEAIEAAATDPEPAAASA